MIAIVSSLARERLAFAALCEQHGWTAIGCETLRALRLHFAHATPRLLLLRHRLADGYSDDVLRSLAAQPPARRPRVVILLEAAASSAAEARQLTLGADCVLRDPVRTDVLVAHLRRYLGRLGSEAARSPKRSAASFAFAGATILPAERRLRDGDRSIALTPREVQLAQLLAGSRGELVSYSELFETILGRPFRGETSNLRVLLAKLDASLREAGISLRHYVDVVPKAGYRYRARRQRLRLANDRGASRDAAA